MSVQQVRRLPVVEDGRLVGIVSLADLARSQRFDMEAAQALGRSPKILSAAAFEGRRSAPRLEADELAEHFLPPRLSLWNIFTAPAARYTTASRSGAGKPSTENRGNAGPGGEKKGKQTGAPRQSSSRRVETD